MHVKVDAVHDLSLRACTDCGGVRGLPRDFPAPIIVVQHRSPTTKSFLVRILARHSTRPVEEASEGETLKPGVVYVAPPDRHLTLTGAGGLAHVDGRRIHHVLSSATPSSNPLPTSTAKAQSVSF